MKLEEFAYDLPEELIAQQPAAVRDQSRMMVVNRKTGGIEIRGFKNFPEYFGRGDVLVINDSRVIPARLSGRKETGASIEILLLSRRETGETPGETWEVLLRPAKRVAAGMTIVFDGGCRATVLERLSDKRWLLLFVTDCPFDDFLARWGSAPLPPYIRRGRGNSLSQADLERYQTVYARVDGSVAAPTAGLHFTEDVLSAVRERKAGIASVTLHVGYGTFLPITTETVEDHVMEEEHFTVDEQAARLVNGAKRVAAVGTTATRVLETVAGEDGRIGPVSGMTRLYIYPGRPFRRVDALLTNFHLPKSSLFLLVCAFAGRELMQEAYRLAVENRFRFYSFGDCMLIL